VSGSSFLGSFRVPAERLLFSIAPAEGEPLADAHAEVLRAIRQPVGSPPLRELASGAKKVLILADDITRLTPQRLLVPPILDELETGGAAGRKVAILIALGTHRRMSGEEIERHFGPETLRRVPVENHDFDRPEQQVVAGRTRDGTPIVVNRRVVEADLVLGLSSIVPPAQVGWGGGAKIVVPGVCGAETVTRMHLLAADQPDYPRFAGVVDNPVREIIEEVALAAGLRFIVNSVFDAGYRLTRIFAGHPGQAHREGVRYASGIFLRPIPARADIVVVNGHPADLDYWQGLKPVTLAHLAVREGGIIILVGRFPDGISPVHDELHRGGTASCEQFRRLMAEGKMADGLCAGALLQHIRVREWARVFCVAAGLSSEQKRRLGFREFSGVQEALEEARRAVGPGATVGVIDEGGEAVPVLP